MFWGLTHAVDILEEYKIVGDGNLPPELNVLIIGGADCRHVFVTLARKYRHQKVKLKFHLVEACVETIAKQLLLLNVALQPSEVMGLATKTKVFMELFGNTLIRPSVAKFLTSAATELLKMVTNYNYLNEMMHCVKLNIKYKERDYLENLIKFWCSKDDFNICDSWDRRLRKTLGARYDSKMGAFDWDLHMRLHNVGGKQVCNQEYKDFRLNGIAFKWLESEVSKPNRSLVCAILPNGENFVHYGYLGDMQTGPYIAYGLDCEDKSYLNSTNGENAHRATDVTERNLMQIFHELLQQETYVHQRISDMQLGPVVLKPDKLVVDIKSVNIIPRPMKKCVVLENAELTFHSTSVLSTMKYKEEYKNLFDVVYCGSSYLKYIDKNFLEVVAKPKTLLLIENPKFVLTNRKKELLEYEKGIEDKLQGLPLTKVPFDSQNDCYAKFIFTIS